MENPNPNYDERLRPKSWSDLPPDLLISVFERLTFGNFQRAKSVCLSWYSASRQAVPKNQIPWLILFPEDDDNNNNNYSCTLFNPEVKHKLYKTQDLGVEFAKSVCMVTYGSCWLLMRDPLHNIYIMNLFTHERINLPPVQLLWKDYELHLPSHLRTRFGGIIRLRSPVFWIDEKTKDYVVVCGLRDWCVVYSKKGDTSWNQIPQTSYCSDMVYKDHKLYFLSYNYRVGIFKIFDFSEEIPQQTFQCYVRVEIFHKCRQLHQPSNRWSIYATQLVVTVTGEVLKVEKWWRHRDITWSFRVFKIYSSGIIKKPERIYSLGDELMLFDQGITVLANDNDGFIRNSIYFNARNEKNTNDILIFDLETRKTESLLYTLFDTSSIQFSRAQWFLPSFTHT